MPRGSGRSSASVRAPRRTNPAGPRFCGISSIAVSGACSWWFPMRAEVLSKALRIICRRPAINAAWCIFIAMSSATCRPTRVREVSHMLKAIHAQESRAAADEKARTVKRRGSLVGLRMEYAPREAFFLLALRHLHVSSQARGAGSFRRQRVLSRGLRSRHGPGAGDRRHWHVRRRSQRAATMARATRSRPKPTILEDHGTNKNAAP
ncbi:hypothetical protein ACVIQS_000322 [Bradyrhizobium diazoefficiens]